MTESQTTTEKMDDLIEKSSLGTPSARRLRSLADPSVVAHIQEEAQQQAHEQVVRCEGDLDIVTAEDVKRRLAAVVDTGIEVVTLDLRDVGFIDSSGLGALVAMHHFAKAKGAHLVVRSAPAHLRDIFSLTRLDNLLTVEQAE